MSNGRLFSQSALLLLSCRSSLPVQICKKPKFLRSVGILSFSDNFIHNKYRFFSTIVLVYKFRYLGSQHTKAVLALLSVSVTFIYKEHRFNSAVDLLYQFRYVKSRISRAGLAFWSVSHTFIHNKHHFDSTVVLLYQFRYLGNRHTIAVLTFFLSGCIICIQREHRFYSTVGSWFTRAVLAFLSV